MTKKSEVVSTWLLIDASNSLKESLENTAPDKKEKILIQLEELKAAIDTFKGNDDVQKKKILKEFKTKSHAILNHESSTLRKTLIITLTTIIATSVALAAGYIVGLYWGSWTGIRNFIANLFTGNVFAITIAAISGEVGFLGGGLAAYFLLKSSKEVVAVDKFVNAILTEYKPNP